MALAFFDADTRLQLFDGARALLLLGLGLALAKAAGRLIERSFPQISAQHRMLLRRVVAYVTFVICAVAALRHLGFDLSGLLGAAGILTVALGFASQTSASNLISGLFLIGERPFVLGDVIRVREFTGEVVEIGLVSVHLRTFDNLRVRISNEALFKSEIVNYSAYAIRRFEIRAAVAHGQDLERLRKAIVDALAAVPEILDEPRATVSVHATDATSVTLVAYGWCARDLFLDVQTRAHLAILDALGREKAALPVARTAGELAVRVVEPPPAG